MKLVYNHNAIQSMKKPYPEFMMSNGLGGYASMSVLSTNERKHHGYLIASLTPPTNRRLLVGNLLEEVKWNHENSFFSINPFLSTVEISYHPTLIYQNQSFRIQKEFSLKYLHNAVAITYTIDSFETGFCFKINPWLAYRDHSDVSDQSQAYILDIQEHQVCATSNDQHHLYCFVKNASISPSQQMIEDISYSMDIATGDPRTDVYESPFMITKEILPYTKTTIEIVFSLDELITESAESIIEDYDRQMKLFSRESEVKDPNYQALLYAASQFVVKRNSTEAYTVIAGYPWFTDWGRDTMISFEGLLLSTKRFAEAKSILLSFSKYYQDGLIPNMFPDDENKPIYNTVDASLWYINAIYLYHQYTKDSSILTLLPILEDIISFYIKGTHFSIKMDEDGLIHAGNGLDQVTWMDVRVNGEVITPRHGKPVEINALWYNALMIIHQLSHKNEYLVLANKVKQSFLNRFYVSKTNQLLDVVDPDDSSIRPNQIYAIVLPFTMLSIKQSRKVLKLIQNELLDVYGLRTVSIKDEKFIPTYEGDVVKRDHAYHNGTSWGFLLGTYFVADERIYRHHPFHQKQTRKLFNYAMKHLYQNCIFGYSEVFDGYLGFQGKGCFNQAWSIAEMIRAYQKLYKKDDYK